MTDADLTTHETLVDDISTFWVDLPPPYTATLWFRVGQWDETLLTRGITHLMEHLSLYPLRDVQHPHNGAVTGNFMVVQATGNESELRHFFGEFCRHLRSLPMDRLDREAGVLLAESAGQPLSANDYLLTLFFGPNGPGLSMLPERGLECVQPHELQAWADRYCCRRNAVLTLTGPPPATLGIDLPEGEYRPFVLPSSDLGHRPERLERMGEHDGICFGALADRSTSLVLSMGILQQRLTDRLRHDLGLVYAIVAGYLQLDAITASVFFGTDIKHGDLRQTCTEFVSVIDSLYDDGATIEELDRSRREDAQDPREEVQMELIRVAISRLMRYEEVTREKLRDERLRATPADVQAAFRAAVERGGVVAPLGSGLDLPWSEPRRMSAGEGQVFRARWSSRSMNVDRVIVGTDDFSIRSDGRWLRLPWDGFVLVEESAPNAWLFIHRYGTVLTLPVTEFRRWRKLRRLLEQHVPREVRPSERVVRNLQAKMQGAEEVERNAMITELVDSLYREGSSRDAVYAALRERGLTDSEATEALDP